MSGLPIAENHANCAAPMSVMITPLSHADPAAVEALLDAAFGPDRHKRTAYRIREGMAADILIFDERTVGDAATFTNPHTYSKGFKYVIVNGEITIDNGKHNGMRKGIVLKGPGVK